MEKVIIVNFTIWNSFILIYKKNFHKYNCKTIQFIKFTNFSSQIFRYLNLKLNNFTSNQLTEIYGYFGCLFSILKVFKFCPIFNVITAKEHLIQIFVNIYASSLCL